PDTMLVLIHFNSVHSLTSSRDDSNDSVSCLIGENANILENVNYRARLTTCPLGPVHNGLLYPSDWYSPAPNAARSHPLYSMLRVLYASDDDTTSSLSRPQ